MKSTICLFFKFRFLNVFIFLAFPLSLRPPLSLSSFDSGITHNESQSERQAKENKSKCKRIARLLTDAPNPRNKGALLFKKRRQRVKKYTLVSYGTGDNKLDSEDQIEEESEEASASGYNFVATSESELEEEYSVHHQQYNLSQNWGSLREMEALPETRGKGVLMFAQRRKRMDEIVSEQEALWNKEIPVKTPPEPKYREEQNIYDAEKKYYDADYMDLSLNQQMAYQGNIQQMNHLSNVSKPLVANRTAKPFIGHQNSRFAPVMTSGTVPVAKKHEPVKVPVINVNSQYWSPTGDMIASRDERISVPAIKTGILPESRRRGPSKQSHAHFQNKGDRRSYIESEDDCFSLGAEACNFMQPQTVKLKHPPPVAPKPTINQACPPFLRKSRSYERFIPPRSPVSEPCQRPYTHHYIQQQDLAHLQQMVNSRGPDQAQATLQTPTNAWAPVNPSSQPFHQSTRNSWSQQPAQSPVSMNTCSSPYSPYHPPSFSKSNLDSSQHSVASQGGSSCVRASNTSRALPRGQVLQKGTGNGPTMEGKGAELFAKRRSRMEKFIVDAETVQANEGRCPSSTSSLPKHWRYYSNVHAPSPLSYNPLLAPLYPPSATKQPPSTSPKTKPKSQEKDRRAPKQLNTLDIMKHAPNQFETSLFKYDAAPEAKRPSPKPSSAYVTENFRYSFAPSHSTDNISEPAIQSNAEAFSKSLVLVSSKNSPANRGRAADELLAPDKHVEEKHTVTPAAHRKSNKQAPSARPTVTSSPQPFVSQNIALAFSPASLIARGTYQMAPRPKFCAKKPVATGPQWRPVALLL